ncbi:MAG: membrane protein insertase YidC [Bacteroidia bacterium]|jgi:YidC/Oxa1 family membrane protein insertase|nr:membrane protein insertase YidC [Bacteroidia bacterium]
MDRNSMIGLGLIFLILITFAWINQPSEEELKTLKLQKDSIMAAQLQQDSLSRVTAQLKAQTDSLKNIDTAFAKQSFGTLATAAIGTEQFVNLENDELKLTFSNKGGALKKVVLKKHKTYYQKELILFDGENEEMNYILPLAEGKTVETKDLFFTPEPSADGKSLSMVLYAGDGKKFVQQYSLTDNANLIDYKVSLEGMNKLLASDVKSIEMKWRARMRKQEKTKVAEERTTTIYFKTITDEPDYISETKEETITPEGNVKWVSFKQQYFNASLIAEQSFTKAVTETRNDATDTSYIKYLSATLTIPVNNTANDAFNMQLYFGSNHYKTLKKLDIQLERIVPMGWGIFRWVNKYLTVNVFYFLSQYIGSFGIIIFLLTLIVKTILFPLVYRSYLSTAKMRVLKPEMDEIKEKYGDDLARVQQENMKIYRQAGVNPLGGCLPVLLQMPILIAMFQFFPSAFELRQQAFLWAEDLSTFDSVLSLPFSIPGYGDHVSLFALLMTISSVVYAIYNSDQSGMTGQMKYISYFMPVIFLFVLNSFAAGLNYYYFVSNLFTIGQQIMIRGFVDEGKLHAEIQENKKKPVKQSKLQAKLEEMAKSRGVDLKQGNMKKK